MAVTEGDDFGEVVIVVDEEGEVAHGFVGFVLVRHSDLSAYYLEAGLSELQDMFEESIAARLTLCSSMGISKGLGTKASGGERVRTMGTERVKLE